jgi:hypothetical protein
LSVKLSDTLKFSSAALRISDILLQCLVPVISVCTSVDSTASMVCERRIGIVFLRVSKSNFQTAVYALRQRNVQISSFSRAVVN